MCSVLSQASVSFPPYSAAEASAADASPAARVLAVTEEDSGLLIPVIIVTIVFRILDPKSSWSGVTYSESVRDTKKTRYIFPVPRVIIAHLDSPLAGSDNIRS